MSEYENHIRQSIDGMYPDPHEELDRGEMRWTPAPVSEPVTDEAVSAAVDAAHALLHRAADAYLSLLNAVLGEGTHHMVASAITPHGDLTEGQRLIVMDDALIIDEAASMRVCAVIAAAMVGGSSGGLVVRTFGPEGAESVRGWSVRNFWLRPLTADGIREAYSVDPVTSAPVARETGVEYRQAQRVPRPEQDREQAETGGHAGRTAPPDNRPPNRRN